MHAVKMTPPSIAFSDVLSKVFDESVSGLIVIDDTFQIVLWNNWMESHSSLPREKVIGRSLGDIYPELKGQRVEQAIESAISSGKSTLLSHALNRFPLPLTNPQKQATAIQQMTYVKPLALEGGGRYCLIQINDVSASVQRESLLRSLTKEAQEAKAMAEQVSEIKSAFVSTVSHELRTPLTAIIGSLGLLLGGALGDLSDRVGSLLRVAKTNSERLLLIINDILDIEKIESGKMEYSFSKIPLESLLHQAIESNLPFAEKHGVGLQLGNVETGVAIWGDFGRMMQVMSNLLSNAIKYETKGEAVEVSCRLINEQQIQVSIRDHGPGIPEEYLPRLFERFSQADSSDRREKGGTGLGLAICKAILEEHNATIDVASKMGEGTIVSFVIPLHA